MKLPTRISKPEAIRRYLNGQRVFIQTSKLPPNSFYLAAKEVRWIPKRTEAENSEKEKLLFWANEISSFSYKNCNPVNGEKLHFYGNIK